MVDYTRLASGFAACALAAGCAVSPQRVAQQPVNETTYGPAVVGEKAKPVAINRCIDNGIYYTENHPYNIRELQRANSGFFSYRDGIGSEIVRTGQGDFAIFFQRQVTQNSGKMGEAIGGGVGLAAGSQIGKGRGRDIAAGIGAALGVGIVAPIINQGIDSVTRPFKIAQLADIEACRQDLKAQYGATTQGTPQYEGRPRVHPIYQPR